MAAVENNLIAALMQDSLSCGSEVCISILLRVMARYSKQVARPTVFSSEIGTPNSWKRLVTGGAQGKSTTKNRPKDARQRGVCGCYKESSKTHYTRYQKYSGYYGNQRSI